MYCFTFPRVPWTRFLRTMAAPSRPPPHVAVSVSSDENVGVLVIGEAGLGKTTFINNLLGESLLQDCDSSASSLTVSTRAVKSTLCTMPMDWSQCGQPGRRFAMVNTTSGWSSSASHSWRRGCVQASSTPSRSTTTWGSTGARQCLP